MKLNYNKISIVVFGIVYVAFVIFFLYGCSAQYHFTKFINKGGKIDTTQRVIEVSKTIKVNGKDSIIFFETPVKCPEIQIPPTRTEIRYKYRLDKRKQKAIEQMYSDSIDNLNKQLKYAFKTNKTDKKAETKQVTKVSKSENKSNWLFWFVAGVFAAVLVRFGFNNLLKKL